MSNSRVVLVTGAGGFLGGHVSRWFSSNGSRVVGIDVQPSEAIAEFPGDVYHQIDVGSGALSTLLRTERPDACVHCAGSASVPLSMQEPMRDFRANVSMTAELLEAMRSHAPSCATVLLSSAAVYGSPGALPIDEGVASNPISAYGFHKRMAEELCAEYAGLHGLRTACVRIFSAYGPGLKRQVLWDFCQKLVDAETVVLQGTGAESRDFVHARDVAKAISVVVERAAFDGECYNVASGSETSIAELAEKLSAAMRLPRKIEFDGKLPAGVPARWRADISRIRDLGFTPEVTIDQGVTEYVEWVRPELVWK